VLYTTPGCNPETEKAVTLLLPQNAARGQGVLRVSNGTVFTPGQWVRLVLDAPTNGGIVTDMTSGIIPETADYK
jgi:hypothetical protein